MLPLQRFTKVRDFCVRICIEEYVVGLVKKALKQRIIPEG